MNTKSDAAQANESAPVTVERLRELQAKYRGEVERIDPIGARVVQWTELIVILDELLAGRETIAKLEVELRVSCERSMELAMERSPAVKQATACGDTACVIDRANHRLTAAALHVEMHRVALLEDVLGKLSFAAQITGGVAGRDENLVATIDEAAKVLDDSYAIATEQAIAALTPLTTQPITEQGKDAWIPVSERMPPQRTTILVATEHGVTSAYVCRNGHFHDDAEDDIQGVTHWQPLPDAPSSCTGEGKT